MHDLFTNSVFLPISNKNCNKKHARISILNLLKMYQMMSVFETFVKKRPLCPNERIELINCQFSIFGKNYLN